ERERIAAQEEQEQAQHAVKMIADGTQIAVANQRAAQGMADSWRAALSPVTSSFEDFFTTIIQHTEKTSVAFRNMMNSMLIGMAKSGMQGALFGGKEGTTQGSLFGGGLVGGAQSLLMGSPGSPGVGGSPGTGGSAGTTGILGWLLGPTQVSSMLSVLKGTGGASGGLFGWLFGTIGSTLMGQLGLGGATAATQAAGSAAPAAGAAPTAAGGISLASGAISAGSNLVTAAEAQAPAAATGAASAGAAAASAAPSGLSTLSAPLLKMVAFLGMMSATQVEQLAESLLHTAYLGLIAAYDAVALVFDAVIASPSALGFHAAGGGVIPSAAGGMVIGGGYGGFPAILHPREMVLPRYLSEGFQHMLGQGGDAGNSQQPHVHFHVSAMDDASVRDFFDRNGDNIARSIHTSVRNSNPHMRAAVDSLRR
ncbi:MAG: hypothetical protein ACYDC3_08280, partial [Candidatus Binataceae bacterium]